METPDRVILMKKEIVEKTSYINYNIHYYFITKNNKDYLYIDNENYGNKEEELLWVIDNKIELIERYKNLKDETNKESFIPHIKEDEDILKRARYYMSYHDDDTKWGRRSFALVELTEDDLTKYLHYIM
jgi:hypothetical protein